MTNYRKTNAKLLPITYNECHIFNAAYENLKMYVR